MRALSGLPFLVSCVLVTILPACSNNGGGGGREQGGSGNVAGGVNPGMGGRSGDGGGISSTGGVVVGFGGTAPNLCDQPGAPSQCKVVSPPGCGDGKVNQPGIEECDDSNSVPGDGCSGICKVEQYWICPTEGQPCVSTIICGDGKLGPGEACDDNNTTSGDGCAENCRLVEPGYSCRTEGKPCARVYVCGDGIVDPNEGCDDKNGTDGDGCSAHCRIEASFKCEGAPSTCSHTTCGDKKVEGAESCDDGNKIPFDGCSPDCQAEPTCPASGDCASSCGDGIVLGEECDDGNLRDGDGCSSKCKLEEGFKCTNDAQCELVNDVCSMTVPAIYRDFNAHDSTGGHPDFQPGTLSPFELVLGLVKPTWDDDKKPVFSGKFTSCVKINASTGVRTEDAKCGGATATVEQVAYIHSTDSFSKWYRDGSPGSGPIPGTIRLFDDGKGGYVNRFGPNGEQWVSYPEDKVVDGVTYPHATPCSTTDCTDPACADVPAGMVCLDDCVPWGSSTQACIVTPAYINGNPLFFPLDPTHPGILDDKRLAAKIPEQYGYVGWPWESVIGPVIGLKPSGVKCDTGATTGGGTNWCHNFSFTTEVKYWFKYDRTKTARLDFTGDDDVWVFVNGQLAVDLGGWHVPVNGAVTIDSTAGTKFNMKDGQVYEIGVFQAERETEGSTFKLTLSGFNMVPSDCRTDCGDAEIAPGEECDDGAGNNTGEYNKCSPSCTLGPRCGDRVKQTDFGEECDDGTNDGSYGGCAPTCKLGPHCGDAVVQLDQEQCDDGKNDGSYGTCAAGCKLAAHCGDGHTDEGHEECDDGNNTDKDGCSAACKIEHTVPI